MKSKTALKAILVIAICGTLFSGYLSYNELFKADCGFGCSNQGIFGIPVCVFGLVMYLAITTITILGIIKKED